MLRKLRDGLLFGAGVGIALAIVWSAYIFWVVPSLMSSMVAKVGKAPEFRKPIDAKIAKTEAAQPEVKDREFSVFKNSGSRMEIPDGGGIIGIATVVTEPNAKKPSTYQLWLTKTEFWQVRTTEDKAQLEKLSQIESADVETLHAKMREAVGFAGHQGTMTVSKYEIQNLKTGSSKGSRSGLNGELRMTVEGVVFFMPNDYERINR